VAKLEEGYINLENLSIFGSIEIDVKEKGDGVALEYTFREMPSFIPYLAFRYTEENGFSVGPAISSVNLTGRAIGLSGRLLFGGTTQMIIKMKWPWITGDYRLSLDLDANHIVREDKLNEFEETSTELTPWFGRWLGETGRLQGMAGYFRMESDTVGITLDPDQADDFFQAGGSIGIDTRDSWRTPHHGWEGELELVGFAGSGNFLTTILDIRRFQPLSERQTLFLGWLTSLRTGTVGEDVPVYLQYRMGGANSIRGYDIDKLGRTLYGKNQMIGTFEYQFNILPLRAYNFMKWSAALGIQLAAFSDVGIAWSDDNEFTWDRTKTGFGLGVRLLVPGTEMTRFDVGFNPDGDVYFHFGNWFKWTAQRFRLR
jgi:outer membrane protein assembly factor BamA